MGDRIEEIEQRLQAAMLHNNHWGTPTQWYGNLMACYDATDEIYKAESDLIGHAPDDLRYLLAQLTTALSERDRLREALELIAAPKRADGTYNRCRETCEQLAIEALEYC